MADSTFTVVTHDVLFEEEKEAASRCDVCGREVAKDDADDGFELSGRGLYVWTRGTGDERETRYEEPPLCASCGTAIGVTALAQWDLEEEEG